jgi:hypothetical protein
MKYYFDESGNWQEIQNENRNLVIGGVLIKDENHHIELSEEFKWFMAENRLKHIHMNELEEIQREELLKIILKYLKDGKIKSLLYVTNPKYLYSKTTLSADDIYIGLATELISNIAFGDENIEIEYDMKFHYAYPVNILEEIDVKKEYDEFTKMSKNFVLNLKNIEKIQNRIKTNLLRGRVLNVEQYLDRLNDKKFLSRYLWEEFRLKVQKGALLREAFLEKSKTKLETKYKKFGIDKDIKIKIDYKGKYIQSAGVGVIDVLTNIVRYNGSTPKKHISQTTKDIFSYIKVKEIKND